MREAQKHKDAFEYWLSLGGKANNEDCRQIAEKFHISERTFWNWYKELNWANRRDIRLNARAKKLEDKVDNAVVDRKAKELAEVDELDAILMEKARATTGIDIEDAKDLASIANVIEKLKKLKQLLIGEDTERIDGKIKAFFDVTSANDIDNEPIDDSDDE